MKVVIAIDSFKGSMSSMEAGRAAKQGILKAVKDAEVIVKPLADGGEGTTEALVDGLGGEFVEISVTGPLGKPVKARYGYLRNYGTAIIEMAEAAGIVLVKDRMEPLEATTFGVGEMIRDAILKGCRNFIVGIGGSATNDGGIGMLRALGVQFYDEAGNLLGMAGKDLGKISSISAEHMPEELRDCHFKIACDVNNPLCGPAGATYIYGPQKGITEEMKEPFDKAMAHYAEVTNTYFGTDYSNAPGAGAAGGLGFAFLSYLNAALQPGIDLVLHTVSFEDDLAGADYVITGEGRLDYQTSMGKAPVGVAKLAKKYDATVIALAGSIIEGAEECNNNGIDAFFPILTRIVTLPEAMDKDNAKQNMAKTAEQLFRLISSVKQTITA